MSNANLKKYYRTPGLTVQLPSRGKFMPEGAVTFVDAEKSEVEVYPMRAADEMMLKNPDALMSGSAVQSLFESCVPGIATPALISSQDIDVLLLAIRVATYGRVMELEATCPECKKDLAFDCNLPDMLATVKEVSADNEVRLSDDLTAMVRPFNVSDIAFMSGKIFEEERRLQQIEASDHLTDEQRQEQRNLLYKRMSNLQSEMLSHTVLKVTTPEGVVTDKTEIDEFMGDISTIWVKTIESTQKMVSEGGMEKTIPITCEHCAHEWRTTIDFDPSSFFGPSSSA